ncbi:PmeII family type II restriction endonuclease [Runella sp.]|uniref:PmeII family type II restriction endonuclease n=1 Tax=Runella sp. TaxID=1960881 RepID=UPI003017828D
MPTLNLTDVSKYVEENIGVFHKKRIQSLDTLKLKTVLKRKNPYLFKAKHVLTASDIVKSLVDAHISSNEETIFGDWLEGLAIFINQKVFGGRKSGIPGIDLEFDANNIRHIVSIKSGPNWGNSSQIKKMIDNFNTARKTLKTTGANINVMAVNGCCYGRQKSAQQYSKMGDYYKICGQAFWEFLSGDSNLYTEIIEPIGFKAREKNDEFIQSYSQMLNKFTKEFTIDFCTETGEIDWEKLVRFNSARL